MQLTQFTLLSPTYGRLETKVPFSVYQTLYDHAIIPDPYFRDNEKQLTKLSEQDYTFESRFTLFKEDLAKPYGILVFEGIDTIADLFLNGTKFGEARNMHRTYSFDVRTLLQEGENVLTVLFHSPLRYIQEKQRRHFTWGQSGTSDGFGHIRKASSMFGWDWAPTLPDMGIYRPVDLILYETDLLDDIRILQEHAAQGETTTRVPKVTLHLSVTTKHGAAGIMLVRILHPDGASCEIALNKENGVFTGSYEVPDPQLWWIRGYGDQPLYTLQFELYDGDRLLDSKTKRIGLRTLTVSTAEDQWGHEFAFVLNGIKIFAMGADYVPEDSLLPRITPERTRKLLEACAGANFNCVRVWGGGYYPSDAFYDICDELGLAVWQDFMFACVNVRLSKEMKENLEAEFICQIKRLRHHASLGLLCGNNEMETALLHWDGCKDSLLAKSDYLELYERMLPDLCDEYAPEVFYWPSSPSSGGGFDEPDDPDRGDAHYWGAWHGSIPFESYRQYYFRFLSEFGFEAFPNIKTVRSYTLPEDENPFSVVMEAHQKCLSGNTKILTYLSDKYRYPYTFEDLIYASQLLQLDAIRYGVEHFRRFRGRSMGTVYWQLNDCWPVASWSSVDYFGRFKALMYGSRRFYAPILLSAHEKGTVVTLNLSNETRQSFEGTLTWNLIGPDFASYAEGKEQVAADALSSKDIITLDLGDLVKGHKNERLLTYRLTDQEGAFISSGSLLMEKPKAFLLKDPALQIAFEATGDPCTLTAKVSAENYAKYVEVDFKHLDASLSDNYFDLISSEPRLLTVRFDQPVSPEEAKQDCVLRSVYNIGQKA